MKDLTPASNNKIAIIGMSCRFPGAQNVEQFWDNLMHARDSIRRDDGTAPHGLIDDAEYFDADYFKMSVRESRLVSPQHRVFLEGVHNALEHAAYDPLRYSGLIGLYAGGADTGYANQIETHRDKFLAINEWEMLFGTSIEYMTARAAYKLDLRGPAIGIQGSCATASVVVHTAVNALLAGDCDIAIAGAISIHVPAKISAYTPGGIISKDGFCRAFDADASGTIGSDGAGFVVLKPLEKAIAENDHIYGVICGTAINNDGKHRIGFTAPSVEGESRAIRSAMKRAGVSANDVSYIEAHGTATQLGDQIELSALTQVFRETTDKLNYCPIGSVKTNIGHTHVAAGMAGLIKTTLAMIHEKIPASLHYDKPNPQLNFEQSPFKVASEMLDWPRGKETRYAGVSSFGMGGMNTHIVLQEAPLIEQHRHTDNTIPYILPLSAKTPEALAQLRTNLANYLSSHSHLLLADVAWTLQVGRIAHKLRQCVIATTVDEAIYLLSERNEMISYQGNYDDQYQIAKKWCNGEDINWYALMHSYGCKRIALPTYPFQRKRYTLESDIAVSMSSTSDLNTQTHNKGESNIEEERIAKVIMQAFSDALNCTQIDLDSNFFDLGGDSFIAITLFDKLNNDLNLSLDPADIYDAETPRQLASVALQGVS